MHAYKYDYDIALADLHPLYGHVHHADCLKLLERARIRFLEDIGCSYESLIAEEMFLVITKLAVEYKRELRAGPVSVFCENARMEGKSVVIEQKIVNERGKCAVQAIVELKFVRPHARFAAQPPKRFVNCLASVDIN